MRDSLINPEAGTDRSRMSIPRAIDSGDSGP
jgi:hypothetical protein